MRVALLLLGLCACQRSPTGVAIDRIVREPSGVVASARHEGVLWIHGDSGTANWLFAVDRQGKLLERIRVTNLDNVDWEDITRDDQGNLWIGDIGNNDSDRHDLAIHRVPEPDPRAEVHSIDSDLSIAFRYADQEAFGRVRDDFDAEALMFWEGRLWLATKHRTDHETTLYRFPPLDSPLRQPVVLEPLAHFDLGASLGEGHPASDYPGMATAADVEPGGALWGLLTYDAIFLFALEPGQIDLFARPVARVALDPRYVGQVEALTFEGGDIVLVNEARAVFRVDRFLERSRYP